MSNVVFASAHSIVDFSNGASVATLDMLQGLAAPASNARHFARPSWICKRRFASRTSIGDLHEPYRASAIGLRRGPCAVCFTRAGSMCRSRSSAWNRPGTSTSGPRKSAQSWNSSGSSSDVYRPDVMLTYGGDPITQGMMAVAKRREFRSCSPSTILRIPTRGHFLARRLLHRRLGVRAPALSRQGGPGLPGVAQPGRLGARSGRGPRTAFCHVHQSGARKGRLSVCTNRQRAGPPPARYSAAGRREPGDAEHTGRVRARPRAACNIQVMPDHDRPATVLAR